jgi:hypothetical protein
MDTQPETGQDRFRTKKSYGQNFLRDRQVVPTIWRLFTASRSTTTITAPPFTTR